MRHIRVIFSFIAFLCVAAAFPSSAAQIIYVNQNAPANSSTNGTSWANAYRELRDALNNPSLNPVAGNPVEIWVAKGTYLPAPAGSTNRAATFLLKSHLRILGGFKGTETNDTQRLVFG